MDPPLHRRHYIVAKFSHPEMITKFVKSSGKSGRTGRTLEPQHRLYPLFDATMVLLKPIVQIPIGPVLYGAYPKPCLWLWDSTPRSLLLPFPAYVRWFLPLF